MTCHASFVTRLVSSASFPSLPDPTIMLRLPRVSSVVVKKRCVLWSRWSSDLSATDEGDVVTMRYKGQELLKVDSGSWFGDTAPTTIELALQGP